MILQYPQNIQGEVEFTDEKVGKTSNHKKKREQRAVREGKKALFVRPQVLRERGEKELRFENLQEEGPEKRGVTPGRKSTVHCPSNAWGVGAGQI